MKISDISHLIIALAFAFFCAAQKEGEPNPIDPSKIRFIGRTKNPTEPGWLIDTSTDEKSFTGRYGVTYYYKCGEYSDTPFKDAPCGRIRTPKGCSDRLFSPFFETAETECSTGIKTGVTVFIAKGQYRKFDFQIWRDACGWLGGRCAPYYTNAIAFVIPGTDVRTHKGFSRTGYDIDVDVYGIGAIKVYPIEE